jgi:hypothetical protein
MKDKPQNDKSLKVFNEEDWIDHIDENKQTRDYQLEKEEESLYAQMRKSEEMMAFCQDVVEEIKTLTEYHVIPVGEFLSPEMIESFVEKSIKIHND